MPTLQMGQVSWRETKTPAQGSMWRPDLTWSWSISVWITLAPKSKEQETWCCHGVRDNTVKAEEKKRGTRNWENPEELDPSRIPASLGTSMSLSLQYLFRKSSYWKLWPLWLFMVPFYFSGMCSLREECRLHLNRKEVVTDNSQYLPSGKVTALFSLAFLEKSCTCID